MDNEETAMKGPVAEQEQPKANNQADRMAENNKAFQRLLIRRLLLCGVVLVVALVAWKIKFSKGTHGNSLASNPKGRIHVAVEYGSFLSDEKIKLPFSDEVYVGLLLAKAYPSGQAICFRFDAYLRVKEEKHIGEFVVSAVPRIVGEQIELGEWTFGSFDVDDVSADQVKSYNATGEAVFAMFKHKVKAKAMPISNKATKILQMTSAEMVVQ